MGEKGFTVEVTSRYEGWWRYNVALMCGCFDEKDNRTDFVTAESHVANVGSNLKKRPEEVEEYRTVRLETPPCDHLMCYLYLIPHTLPTGNTIRETKPFNATLKISFQDKLLRNEKLVINQWSGTSLELRIEKA